MYRAILVAALCGWTVSAAAQPAQVATRIRNVRLHLAQGVELQVDDLRGHLTSRTSGPPFFDEIDSYLVDIDYAQVAMSSQSLSNLMNGHVFAGDDAPIKKIAIAIDGNELVQSGVLKKGISVPFKMRASVAATTDGRLRIHPTSLKAAGFVDVKDASGVEVDATIFCSTPPACFPRRACEVEPRASLYRTA